MIKEGNNIIYFTRRQKVQQSFKEILNQVQSKNNESIKKEPGSVVAFELLGRHAIEHTVAIELKQNENYRFSAKLDTHDSEISKTMLSPTEVLNHIQSIRQNPLFYQNSISPEEHIRHFKK